MDIKLFRPCELTADLWQTWRDIRAGEPALDSPYFCPEFTRHVAAVRQDVEVAVLFAGSKAVGFLPFQRGALNIGKPVGGKLSDYHGLIAHPGTLLNPRELLRACRLAAWDFDHLVTSQPAFEKYTTGQGQSRYMDLSGGFDEYVRERFEAGSDEIKQTNRKLRKLGREHGSVTFELDSRDESLLAVLAGWKSAQLRASGLTDIFAFPWTTRLLQRLLTERSDQFSVLTSVLRLGNRPLSILYSLRSAGVIHAWFFGYEQEFAPYSPGAALLVKLAESAQGAGISKVDFGKGDERYKVSMGSASTLLWEGTIGSHAPAVWLRSGWRGARKLIANSPLASASALPAKAIQPLRDWLALH